MAKHPEVVVSLKHLRHKDRGAAAGAAITGLRSGIPSAAAWLCAFCAADDNACRAAQEAEKYHRLYMHLKTKSDDEDVDTERAQVSAMLDILKE